MKGFDVHRYYLEFSKHAYERAIQYDLWPRALYATIYRGKVQRFGKHYLKFRKVCGDATVTCIGEVKGQCLKIITVK